MKEDLTRIITTLISNSPSIDSTCEGLNVLKEKWPQLSHVEKEEIAAVILALQTIEEDYNSKSLF